MIHRWETNSLRLAAGTIGLLVIVYGSSFFDSITVYRIFFYRIRRFPGPMMANLSEFWHVSRLPGKPKLIFLDELHQKYGDFVRTGKVSVLS